MNGTAKYSTDTSIETSSSGRASTPSAIHSRRPAPGLAVLLSDRRRHPCVLTVYVIDGLSCTQKLALFACDANSYRGSAMAEEDLPRVLRLLWGRDGTPSGAPATVQHPRHRRRRGARRRHARAGRGVDERGRRRGRGDDDGALPLRRVEERPLRGDGRRRLRGAAAASAGRCVARPAARLGGREQRRARRHPWIVQVPSAIRRSRPTGCAGWSAGSPRSTTRR